MHLGHWAIWRLRPTSFCKYTSLVSLIRIVSIFLVCDSHEDDRLEQPQVPAPDWLVLPDVRSSSDDDSISCYQKTGRVACGYVTQLHKIAIA